MKKLSIRTVETFAFVLPVFDYSDVDDMAPSDVGNSVDFHVYGWKPKKTGGSFRIIGSAETHEEAISLAKEHHLKMAKHYQWIDPWK